VGTRKILFDESVGGDGCFLIWPLLVICQRTDTGFKNRPTLVQTSLAILLVFNVLTSVLQFIF